MPLPINPKDAALYMQKILIDSAMGRSGYEYKTGIPHSKYLYHTKGRFKWGMPGNDGYDKKQNRKSLCA